MGCWEDRATLGSGGTKASLSTLHCFAEGFPVQRTEGFCLIHIGGRETIAFKHMQYSSVHVVLSPCSDGEKNQWRCMQWNVKALFGFATN